MRDGQSKNMDEIGAKKEVNGTKSDYGGINVWKSKSMLGEHVNSL